MRNTHLALLLAVPAALGLASCGKPANEAPTTTTTTETTPPASGTGGAEALEGGGMTSPGPDVSPAVPPEGGLSPAPGTADDNMTVTAPTTDTVNPTTPTTVPVDTPPNN